MKDKIENVLLLIFGICFITCILSLIYLGVIAIWEIKKQFDFVWKIFATSGLFTLVSGIVVGMLMDGQE
jgi:hypothetical protein